MDILAEGVETEEHMRMLEDCGCDLFQGYLFARPMQIADLELYIENETFKPGFRAGFHSGV